MQRYSSDLIAQVKTLRATGSTYGEIQQKLKLKIPKSTLFEWCKTVTLPFDYKSKIMNLNISNIAKAQIIAHAVNKARREKYLNELRAKNIPIANSIGSKTVAKIALAMLCLGEASKSRSSSSFSLGSSDSRIIVLFIRLLKECFIFDIEKVRCTVQCRADQDTKLLEKYWRDIAGIPQRLFYKSRIDPRTIGKPTKRLDYKGVLRVDYFDTNVQLELESLADLLYNYFSVKGPEV